MRQVKDLLLKQRQAHSSHYSFPQAVSAARRVGARRTYFTQIYHNDSHSQLIRVCERLQLGIHATNPRPIEHAGGDEARYEGNAFAASLARSGLTREELLMHGLSKLKKIDRSDNEAVAELVVQEVEQWQGGPRQPVWIRPAYDGLRVKVDAKTGDVQDGYDGELLLTKASNVNADASIDKEARRM